MPESAAPALATGHPRIVLPHEPLHGQVTQFLYDEAALLDSGQWDTWLELLTDDVEYRMPARLSVRNRQDPGFSTQTDIFSENRASLGVRIGRLRTSFAWSEDPPSRTRHFVTNVRVARAEMENELQVSSALLLYRTRADQSGQDLFSAERRDRLRQTADGLRLARRTILLDQSVIGARHLSILF